MRSGLYAGEAVGGMIPSSSKGGAGNYREAASREFAGITKIVDAAYMRFQMADQNGDKVLTFKEFCKVLPESSQEMNIENLQEVFNAVDTDGDGIVSPAEFFLWAIRVATEYHGQSSMDGVKLIFDKYDSNRDGNLNVREFQAAIEPLGFGKYAHAIYVECDTNLNGTISSKELTDLMRNTRRHLSDSTKQFLTNLAFEFVAVEKEPLPVLDTTVWAAADEHELRTGFHQRMNDVGAAADGVWRALLQASNGAKRKLRCKQWSRAVKEVFGHKDTHDILEETFVAIDADNSGVVTFEEFLDWLANKLAPAQRLQKPIMRKQTVGSGILLDDDGAEIKWNPTVLRKSMQKALLDEHMSPLDLMDMFDKSEDGELSKKEFVVMIKKLMDDDEAWIVSNIKEAAIDVFLLICQDDDSVDVEEFTGWLLKGWRQAEAKHKKELHSGAKNLSCHQQDTSSASQASQPVRRQSSRGLLAAMGSTADSSTMIAHVEGGDDADLLHASSLLHGDSTIGEVFEKRKDLARRKMANLRAASKRATAAAEQAQVRARRLAEAAVHAAAAVAFFKEEEMSTFEDVRRARHSQDTRRKMLDNRTWREQNHPALGVTLAKNPSQAQSQGSMPRLESVQPTPSAVRLKSSKSEALVRVPIASGGFTGVPGGRGQGKLSVPYWA